MILGLQRGKRKPHLGAGQQFGKVNSVNKLIQVPGEGDTLGVRTKSSIEYSVLSEKHQPDGNLLSEGNPPQISVQIPPSSLLHKGRSQNSSRRHNKTVRAAPQVNGSP